MKNGLNLLRPWRPLGALIALLSLTSPAVATLAAQPTEIDQFVEEMQQRHDFNATDLRRILGAAKVQQSILRAISNPAEKKPWSQYRPIFVTAKRAQEGTRFWQSNRDLLQQAAEKYGVAPEIIVAIIGVETRFGRHTGGYRVLDALVTLAFNYPPRSPFFRSELEQFLLLSREEQLDPRDPKGSYAGAMGQPQFISSSYRAYAVDFDGDGRRNLWSGHSDVIGSVANYFSRHGWQRNAPVVYPARIQGDGYKALLDKGLRPYSTLGEMRALGIAIDAELDDQTPATLIELDGKEGKEYWVGLKNFYVITRYNHSPLYAMAVFQLAEKIKAGMTEVTN